MEHLSCSVSCCGRPAAQASALGWFSVEFANTSASIVQPPPRREGLPHTRSRLWVHPSRSAATLPHYFHPLPIALLLRFLLLMPPSFPFLAFFLALLSPPPLPPLAFLLPPPPGRHTLPRPPLPHHPPPRARASLLPFGPIQQPTDRELLFDARCFFSLLLCPRQFASKHLHVTAPHVRIPCMWRHSHPMSRPLHLTANSCCNTFHVTMHATIMLFNLEELFTAVPHSTLNHGKK